VAITMHRNPDGDALGSALGLKFYLEKKGYTVQVVAPSEYGDFLKWLPGNEMVINYEADPTVSLDALKQAELLFCLDFNQTNRTDDLESTIVQASNHKILIDHHLEPEGFEDYALWDPNAAATAELVYTFIDQMNDLSLLDKTIGTCLYTGILTDSGSFRFSSTSPRLHRIAAHMLEVGVDHVKIQELIYDSFTEDSLRFFGHCFNNRLYLFHDHRTAIIEVTKADMEAFGISKHQTEGLVNFALSLNEVVFAAVVKEGEGFSKISFRSKSDFPANEFARKFFEGGGHRNAAGGIAYCDTTTTIKRFYEHLAEYKALLNKS
jgi:phosphoesterase RecJ-like protein